jgi:hypothetical protein
MTTKEGDGNMVKRTDQSAALAPTGNGHAALAASPEDDPAALAELLDSFDFGDNDGLKETDAEDLRLPVIVWNMKGRDERTQKLRQLDEFYDTLNETYTKELRCAFIHLHKTNAFTRFNQESNANVIHCSSNNRVIGRLRTVHPDLGIAEGTERPCESCPDKDWYRNEKGKNVRNCDTVYAVFGVHLDPDLKPTEGFLLRFKRTALPAFKAHMQRHHLNKRPLPNGKRGNVPLFAFEVTMRLEVDKGGNFAVPVIERGRVLPRATLVHLAEELKFFSEIGDEATRAAERQEHRHEAAIDTTGTAGGAPVISGDDFADS